MSSGTDIYKTTKALIQDGFQPPLPFGKGTKNDQGKEPLTLIPKDFLLGMAAVFDLGSKKYGKHNYRKGIEISRTLDAAMRHILAFNEREDLDPETKLNHLLHAGCSLAMTVYNLKHNAHLDDRPTKG